MGASDEQLVARVRAGESGAFDLLYARYGEAVRRHLASVVRDASATEDLLQEVFLRLWTRADQWSGRGSFRAWFFRIATNLALNHLRAARRRRELPLEPLPGAREDEESLLPAGLVDAVTPGPEVALEQSEQAVRLRRLIEALPEEKREVLRMVHEEELEIREVAERLSLPEGTVKSRLHHARRRLAQAWEALEAEE